MFENSQKIFHFSLIIYCEIEIFIITLQPRKEHNKMTNKTT